MEVHRSSSNPLHIGISTLQELEQKVKAFRTINLHSKKKRFVIARETIKNPVDGGILVKKGEEIDVSKVLLLKRFFKMDHIFKTFQPDEGILIISDMKTPAGIQLSMDLVTQVAQIGQGQYDAFIDRLDSFTEMKNLLSSVLFPKMVIIGYIPLEKIEEETEAFHYIRRVDPYLRAIAVVHTAIKPIPVFPRVKQCVITPGDINSLKNFVIEVVNEYTKPYSIEE